MSKDNITQFKNPASLRDTFTVTLQSAIESIQTWRRSKTKLNEKIPDLIWDQVFSLMESVPELEVLQALGINSSQLRNKRLDERRH